MSPRALHLILLVSECCSALQATLDALQHENAPAGEALLVQALAGLKAAMELQAEQLNADTQALHTLKVRSWCPRHNADVRGVRDSAGLLHSCAALPQVAAVLLTSAAVCRQS